MICKYAEIFCWKNVSSFCSAKATHIFSAKNIRILYIESAKTVNEMTLNELVKLTMLWTTGPWALIICTWKEGYPDKYFSYFNTKTYVMGTHQKCLTEVLLMSMYNICFYEVIEKYQLFLKKKKKSTLSRALPYLDFNRFNPEFLKWTLPSLVLDMCLVTMRVSIKKIRMANSVGLAEMTCY